MSFFKQKKEQLLEKCRLFMRAFARLLHFKKKVHFTSGFTLVELMVSMVVLLIITSAVISDVHRGRQSEELASSLRIVQFSLRDLQADALTAQGVKTCSVSSKDVVCEYNDALCGGAACNQQTSPSAYGMHLTVGSSTLPVFADVFDADLAPDSLGREYLRETSLAQTSAGVDNVFIAALSGDGNPVDSVDITFNRQSGKMRINPCLSGVCTPPEFMVLEIMLRHRQTGVWRVVVLNAVSGKVYVE